VNLILVRHAIAIAREAANDIPDEQRALTPEGIRKMKRVVEGIRRLVNIEQIWTSPLIRAVQTAELLRSGLNLPGNVIHHVAELKPSGDVNSLFHRINQVPNLSSLALVGHEPYLSELMCRLLSAHGPSGIAFKKGGVASFEVDSLEVPERATMEWLMTPKQLRMLGKH
jgi:phosphohistidine phosphatase